MAVEKYAFLGIAVLAITFAAFVFMGGGAHAATPDAQAAAQTTGSTAGQAAAAPSGTQSGSAGQAAATQEVSLTATSSGYDKTEIHVKAGVPVHFSFTAKGAGCGSQLIIDKVGVNLVSSGNTVDATFTPLAPGNYNYHCGMNMFRGVLVAE